jgi:hypothetical protein
MVGEMVARIWRWAMEKMAGGGQGIYSNETNVTDEAVIF